MRYVVRAVSAEQFQEVLQVLREHGVTRPAVTSERRRYVAVDDLQADVIEELESRHATVALDQQYAAEAT